MSHSNSTQQVLKGHHIVKPNSDKKAFQQWSGDVFVNSIEDGGSATTMKFKNARAPGRLSVDIEGDFTVNSSSTATLPLSADYVTLATHATLQNERVLTATAGHVTLTDNGAGSTAVLALADVGPGAGAISDPDSITLDDQGRVTAATAGVTKAPASAEYVVGSSDATLTGELVLTAGTGISVTPDVGTITVDLTDVGPGAGAISDPDSFTLDDQGRVTAATAGVTKAPASAEYVVGSSDGTLTAELVLTQGTGVSISSGAGTITVGLPSIGPGAAAYAAPDSITLDDQGRVTAVSVGVAKAPASAEYIVGTIDATLTNELVLTAGTGISVTPGAGIITVAATGGGGGGGTVQGTDGTYDIEAADEGSTAGNTRGENAVDLQTDRSVNTQVASGNWSGLYAGHDNTAAGTYSGVFGGDTNNADGSMCFVAASFSTDIQTDNIRCAAIATNDCTFDVASATGTGDGLAAIASETCGFIFTSAQATSNIFQAGFFACLDCDIENDLSTGTNDVRHAAIIACENITMDADDDDVRECCIIACETQSAGSNIEGGEHCFMVSSTASQIRGAGSENTIINGSSNTDLTGCTGCVLIGNNIGLTSRNDNFVVNMLPSTSTKPDGDNAFAFRGDGGGGAGDDVYRLYSSSGATGVLLEYNQTSWTTICDANVKNLEKEVNYKEMVEKARGIPSWHFTYKEDDAKIPHMSCTAQDFYAAYKLDTHDTRISTLAFAAVNQATIKGLIELIDELRTEIESLKLLIK